MVTDRLAVFEFFNFFIKSSPSNSIFLPWHQSWSVAEENKDDRRWKNWVCAEWGAGLWAPAATVAAKPVPGKIIRVQLFFSEKWGWVNGNCERSGRDQGGRLERVSYWGRRRRWLGWTGWRGWTGRTSTTRAATQGRRTRQEEQQSGNCCRKRCWKATWCIQAIFWLFFCKENPIGKHWESVLLEVTHIACICVSSFRHGFNMKISSPPNRQYCLNC